MHAYWLDIVVKFLVVSVMSLGLANEALAKFKEI